MKQSEKKILSWFQSKGWTPFKFQRETWRAISKGKSGLLHASTGTGKTMAVWLGLIGKWLDQDQTVWDLNHLKVLWI
ncbi:MAG: hypothetical protein KC978_20260, partial [Candidatus Omnitrophica bacterium]|nr:hypothetical protein [Candidatus Omnitrophota bacterium]